MFQVKAQCQYLPHLGDHLILHRLIQGKLTKIFLSETISSRAQIFDVWVLLWTSLKVVQTMAPGSILSPPRGSLDFTQAYIEKIKKKPFMSEAKRPRAKMFTVKHLLVDFYQDCSNYGPGVSHLIDSGQSWSSCIKLQKQDFYNIICLSVIV